MKMLHFYTEKSVSIKESKKGSKLLVNLTNVANNYECQKNEIEKKWFLKVCMRSDFAWRVVKL